MKRVTALALSGLMAISLVGCGGSAASGASDASGEQKADGAAGANLTLSIGYTTAANENDPHLVCAT